MKSQLFLLSFFILLFQDCGSCSLNEDECLNTYHFEIPMTINPSIDTIKVGDTLYLKSNIPNLLLDSLSKKNILVADFDFGIVNDIIRHEIQGYISAEQEFDVINIVGKYEIVPIADNVTRSLILYESLEHKKTFESGFVAKQPGLYELTFSHLDYSGKTLLDSECTEKIEINVNMNEGFGNNYELLKTSPQPIASEIIYKRWGGYTFVVIE